jgi:hypothetical protein
MLKAQIVSVVGNHIIDMENIYAFMEIRNVAFAGEETRKSLRPELIGLPKFAGFAGPMYGGPGIARYESTEAYKALSQ